MQLGKKGKTSWVGSKCHVVETAEKGKVNFITDMIYQRANEGDQKIHDGVIENNKKKGIKPEKMYADQNYISGASIHRYKKNGQELMGRIASDNTIKPDKFKLDRFEIDVRSKKAKCPMGKESEKYGIRKNGNITIYFSKDDCLKCPHYNDCVGYGELKKRRIHVNKYYDYIRKRRIEQETGSFKKEMSVRAQVEGTISEMVRKSGLRLAKYRGEDGHQLQFYLTGAALNVKRLLRVLVKGREMIPAT